MYKKILYNFYKSYFESMYYDSKQSVIFSKKDEKILNDINNHTKRIGYIVATASPTTKAHLELANKATKELKLDLLYFVPAGVCGHRCRSYVDSR